MNCDEHFLKINVFSSIAKAATEANCDLQDDLYNQALCDAQLRRELEVSLKRQRLLQRDESGCNDDKSGGHKVLKHEVVQYDACQSSESAETIIEHGSHDHHDLFLEAALSGAREDNVKGKRRRSKRRKATPSADKDMPEAEAETR